MIEYLAGIKCVRGENKGSNVDKYNIVWYIGGAIQDRVCCDEKVDKRLRNPKLPTSNRITKHLIFLTKYLLPRASHLIPCGAFGLYKIKYKEITICSAGLFAPMCRVVCGTVPLL